MKASEYYDPNGLVRIVSMSRDHKNPEWRADKPIGPFKSVGAARRFLRKGRLGRWMGRKFIGYEVIHTITLRMPDTSEQIADIVMNPNDYVHTTRMGIVEAERERRRGKHKK